MPTRESGTKSAGVLSMSRVTTVSGVLWIAAVLLLTGLAYASSNPSLAPRDYVDTSPTRQRGGFGCVCREGPDCPRNDYSLLHYHFPTLWKVHRHHCPEAPTYAPDRAPGVPYSY